MAWARPGPAEWFDHLHQQVCDGLMTLAEAQRIISTDWTRELGKVK